MTELIRQVEQPPPSGRHGILGEDRAHQRQRVLRLLGGIAAAYALCELLIRIWFGGTPSGVENVVRAVVFVMLTALAVYLSSARPIKLTLGAQRDEIARSHAELVSQSDRHALTASLQNAFDMVENEPDACAVVASALSRVCDTPSEFMLADSSRAHLRQTSVSTVGAPGCGVQTPGACPAVRRSKTLTFNSSDDIDTCPQLRDRRDGGCSAMCVPVTVLGTPVGVLHTEGVNRKPPSSADRERLEAVADAAGARLSVLRAIASSELQATTDPLTGLLNRRRLEVELADLSRQYAEYAVAFCDLDHFKDLNDTYGHDTGDRALRSFARLLQDTVRDGDMVCRYGGEEFLVVFPGSTAGVVAPVMDRLRASLAAAVASGEVPSFTVSVGISDTSRATGSAEVIRRADTALLEAKESGRDKVVLDTTKAVAVPDQVLFTQ